MTTQGRCRHPLPSMHPSNGAQHSMSHSPKPSVLKRYHASRPPEKMSAYLPADLPNRGCRFHSRQAAEAQRQDERYRASTEHPFLHPTSIPDRLLSDLSRKPADRLHQLLLETERYKAYHPCGNGDNTIRPHGKANGLSASPTWWCVAAPACHYPMSHNRSGTMDYRPHPSLQRSHSANARTGVFRPPDRIRRTHPPSHRSASQPFHLFAEVPSGSSAMNSSA